jgi:hypothetical protein
MKAVIEGRVYNTEAAENVDSDSYGNAGDFEEWSESIYKTKKGAWFLAGSGGARSKYSETVGQNEWSGGEKIIPLSDGEALQWLEEHASSKVIEEHFGDKLVEA